MDIEINLLVKTKWSNSKGPWLVACDLDGPPQWIPIQNRLFRVLLCVYITFCLLHFFKLVFFMMLWVPLREKGVNKFPK